MDNLKAFLKACEEGDYDSLKDLIAKEDVDAGAGMQTPLQLALRSGNKDCIELLLSNDRVDPNKCKDYPLIVACEQNNIEIVRLFLNCKKFDPYTYRFYPLNIPASKNNLEIIRLFLDDERFTDKDELHNFLIGCAYSGYMDVIKMVMNEYQDRFDKYELSYYCLDEAMGAMRIEVFDYFLEDARIFIKSGGRKNG